MACNQNPVFVDGTTVLGDGTEEHPLSSVSPAGANFASNEVPAGATPGTAFTLAQVPVAGSLQLFWNGVLLKGGGVDYTLVGNALTMVQAVQNGDSFLAFYRF